MAEVFAEHKLNGHDHIDCATCGPLFLMYSVMHVVVFLVWWCAILGRHGDAQ